MALVEIMLGVQHGNQLTLLDLTKYAWMEGIVEGKLVCDWESSENQPLIWEHVGLLLRGCSCSSATACSTCHCSCVKKGRCGPGCRVQELQR